MKRTSVWLWTIGLCALAFACFAYPMYVIRPFRAQGAGELQTALAIRAWGPWVAIACALASVTVLIRSRRWWAAPVVLLTLAFAALSQVNVFEMMFKPVPSPGFIAASQAKVDADDLVLSVSLAGEARAYPIRTMGYHHVVNDSVGGTPIVGTY